jgi:hypothetical protein
MISSNRFDHEQLNFEECCISENIYLPRNNIFQNKKPTRKTKFPLKKEKKHVCNAHDETSFSKILYTRGTLKILNFKILGIKCTKLAQKTRVFTPKPLNSDSGHSLIRTFVQNFHKIHCQKFKTKQPCWLLSKFMKKLFFFSKFSKFSITADDTDNTFLLAGESIFFNNFFYANRRNLFFFLNF